MASSSSSQSQSLKRPCITAHYLLSPLETLDESLSDQDEERIDLHDLAEAYNVLATRIARIVTKGVESTAIPLLAERSSILVPALRRDLMRFMINPCLSSDDMGPDQVQYASDLALLGQQALRVISDLFTIPELYKTIPGDQLRLLLGDILHLLSQPSLPTPQSKRTFALLRFILQVQKLPTNVLAPHKSKIIASVKRCLNGNEQVDGLMILAELLRTQPKLFLGPACDFLDKALKSLIDYSSKARYAAAHALSAFASAKLAHNLTYTQKVSHELSRVVRKFLEADRVVLLLPKILESACQVTQVVFDGEGPQWAAVVMASFIVLIDYPIFDSRAMRTIKDRLWDTAEHEGRIVRRLSGPVWRCFVWAFARMPAEKDKAKEREMVRKVQTFLSQDYRSGTGAEMCRVFFSHASGESVERVVEVVEVMLKEKKMQQDGLILLAQLLAPAPPQETQTPTPAPTPTRFDTNAILHSHLFNGNILKSDLPSLHEYTPRHKADVRPLSVQETINHWDELYDFCMVGVGLVLRDSALLEIPKSILTAWQTLLLADSEFSQSQGFHLAPSPKLVYKLGDLCSALRLPVNVTLDVQVQVELELKQIRLLHKLWQTAQRTFSQLGLEETRAVELFLGGVVRRDFRIGEGRVQGEWVRMCQGVVVYPSREELLCQLEDGGGVGGETSPSRSMFNMQTWVIIARRWVEEGVAGDSLVTFLKFPFPERLMTDEEIELWGMLFRVALAAARVHRGANEAAMGLWQALVPDGGELPLAFPKQFHALLSAFVIPFENKTLAEQVLHVMNSVLNSLYPPSMDSNTNPTNTNKNPPRLLDKDMDISLRYIATIYNMIISVPDTLLVSSLAMVCHSISRWLEDKSEVIPDQIYFKHIFPLYSQVLNRLIKEQPNQKTLNTLWMLFIAPLDGPESRAGGVFNYFEDFWLATYHKRPEFIPQYEPELKMVLKGLGKVDERGFAAGLTQSDDSQGTVSVVPETQSLEPVPITGSQVIAQYCDAFAAAQLNKNNDADKSLEIVPSSSSPIREPLPVSSNTTPRRKMDNFLEIVPSSCSPIRESSSVASGRNLDTSMAVDDQDLDRPLSSEIVPSSSSLIRELLLSSNTTPRRKMDNFLEIIPSSCSPIRESSSVASGRNLDASMAVDDQDLDRTSKSIGKKRKRHSKDLEIVEDSQPSSSSSSTRAQDVSQSRGGADPITDSQSYSMNLRCQQQVATPSSKGKAKAAQHQQTPAKRRQKASGVGVSASLSWNQLMTPEPSITPSSHGRAAVLVPHLEEEEEDYDWEKEVVSPASFAQISRELDADAPADADVDMDPPDPNDGAVNSPSVRPVKKRKTSPVTTAALNSPTPSGRVTRSGTTSAKVLQLQRALQALNDDQTPMEDLAQASKLAQEFGSSVNEKIASRNQSKRRVRRS